MKLYVLMEDTPLTDDFAAEHGLSIYIETEGRHLLFDMGQTGLFAQNAARFGLSIARVDVAFVSHGHYDHGGGLPVFLELNDHAPIYVQKDAFQPHYSQKTEGLREIGLPSAMAEKPRIVQTEGMFRLDARTTLFSDIHTAEYLPQSNRVLFEAGENGPVPDRFLHEQSLLLEERGRYLLFTGCAHRGILNICARAHALIGRDPDYVIGGLHLSNPDKGSLAPDANIEQIGARLAEMRSVFLAGHCTGEGSFARLRELLGERILPLRAGSVYTL